VVKQDPSPEPPFKQDKHNIRKSWKPLIKNSQLSLKVSDNDTCNNSGPAQILNTKWPWHLKFSRQFLELSSGSWVSLMCERSRLLFMCEDFNWLFVNRNKQISYP
jgi:hypothetical protein